MFQSLATARRQFLPPKSKIASEWMVLNEELEMFWDFVV